MFIIPGVTGSSEEPYVKEICGVASAEGYKPVVLNCLATSDDDVKLRVLDMSDPSILKKAIDTVHERYGKDVDIYGVGFSLGANHLLRYLGVHNHDHGIKAAISISNPFDAMATCIRLKYKFFGIYDKCIQSMLSKPFLE